MKMMVVMTIAGSEPDCPMMQRVLQALAGREIVSLTEAETILMDRLSEDGACYWAYIEETDSWLHAETDLGSPLSVVELRAPIGTPVERMLAALDAAVQVLLREGMA